MAASSRDPRSAPPQESTRDSASESVASALDELADATEAAAAHLAEVGPFVGECVDAAHPVLIGRVKVRWSHPGGDSERWLPALHGMAIRAGDRLLVQRAANWPEAIVTGVIDGFARRPDIERTETSRLVLERDETLRVTTPEGEALLEVVRSEAGPVVRLLRPDVEVEVAGKLRLSAHSIELVAKQGEARIQASADVNVVGETINLN